MNGNPPASLSTGASKNQESAGRNECYGCILADPPWNQGGMAGGRYKSRRRRPRALRYQTMTIEQISALPVGSLALDGAHLWLWTTNQYLRAGFEVMEAWGFRYLAPIHWIKPSGLGNWFVHRTQTILFGYKRRCRFPLGRYKPNIIQSTVPARHSQKPAESYALIEAISPGPRLELFARTKREGWHSWGDEVPSDVEVAA